MHSLSQLLRLRATQSLPWLLLAVLLTTGAAIRWYHPGNTEIRSGEKLLIAAGATIEAAAGATITGIGSGGGGGSGDITDVLPGTGLTGGASTGSATLAIGSVPLLAIHAITPAADRLFYYTSSSAGAVTAFSAFMRGLIDDADAATGRATLGAAASGPATSSGLTLSTARILGRTTAATGAIEEITIGAGLSLAAGQLSSTAAQTPWAANINGGGFTLTNVGAIAAASLTLTTPLTATELGAGSVDASELVSTAVTPGAYTSANITVDADGRITAAANGAGGGGGTATDGDSATAFFPAGQIERARGGTGADTSAYGTGLLGSDGANASVDVDTIAEFAAALGTTGTPSASTFLRGDNTFATPAGSGTVTASAGPLTANSLVVGADGTDVFVAAGITTDGVSTINLNGSQAANTSADALVLIQPTAATSGNQQYSPRIRLTGQGWKTTATAASQTVDWAIENRPVQGTTNPTTNLTFLSQVNSGGYTSRATLDQAGKLSASLFSAAQLNITSQGYVSNSLAIGQASFASNTRLQVAGAISAGSWLENGALARFDAITATNTSTAAAGTAAMAAFVSVGQPTLAATNAITTTNAATLFVEGNVLPGTNQTLTNTYGFWNAGNTRLDGILKVGTAPTTLTDAAGKILSAALNTVGPTQGGTGVNNGSNTLTLGGNATTPAGTVNLGYLEIPQNSQSTAYGFVLTDSGKHILHPTADNTARTFTIPANGSVGYPVGTCITVVNQINTVTIAITTDTLTWYNGAGTASTGSRTLAAGGVATLLKISATSWIITGPGVS